MNVLFVDHATRIFGGAELNLVELLEANAEQPLWVSVCACAPQSRLSAALRTLQIAQQPHQFGPRLNELRLTNRRLSPVALVRAWSALRSTRCKLQTMIETLEPDAVVSVTNKDSLAVGPLCRAARIPSVWWINDIFSTDFFSRSVLGAFQRRARRYATRLVAVSDFAGRALINLGLPKERVAVIQNGIPIGRYQGCRCGDLRNHLNVGPETILIGCIGRFTPWKGQAFFLKLARSFPHAYFLLIGQVFNEDQPFELELREFVRKAKLENRVRFIPFQDQLAPFLADLDIVVHTSLRPEPFGRVIIEAMAAGRPVLAARAGGVPEIITHGHDGLLAAPGDLAGYAAGLAQLIAQPQLRRALGHSAARTAAARFSIQRVHRQFSELFQRLTSPRAGLPGC